MNTFEKAIVDLANTIWKTGSNNSVYCLTPSCFAGLNESSLRDDAIINELNVTHFTLAWEDRSETVKITFYKGDTFGACWYMERSAEFIVNLKTSAEQGADVMDYQLLKRIGRIETRLVQLMLRLGADPTGRNPKLPAGKRGIVEDTPDLSKCPQCGGDADNGHDRCDPPTAYLCSKCTEGWV